MKKTTLLSISCIVTASLLVATPAAAGFHGSTSTSVGSFATPSSSDILTTSTDIDYSEDTEGKVTINTTFHNETSVSYPVTADEDEFKLGGEESHTVSRDITFSEENEPDNLDLHVTAFAGGYIQETLSISIDPEMIFFERKQDKTANETEKKNEGKSDHSSEEKNSDVADSADDQEENGTDADDEPASSKNEDISAKSDEDKPKDAPNENADSDNEGTADDEDPTGENDNDEQTSSKNEDISAKSGEDKSEDAPNKQADSNAEEDAVREESDKAAEEGNIDEEKEQEDE
ncbi:hypothetical protein [Salisediminibacterium halotolerans]|uniref:hypothetical protein n=1 Tax=Salisediminibacterium halotolerans TaxID=517425 RepID=UPI000EABA8A5|nr:hypothetical protein [Salisediminibacterium halotolerans]RLJ81088.1 hypothetical protein BCL39_0025 [Actinophytocola xinjiangensis]RPE84103.1 hypothetical protein EDD67_2666 [Salisediminibacterium halotolerans]TWG38515.1 hypothetical protein BCL52_0025 [Salisediminibacterium halotolerans]GEL09092.1 hypothetical protein SHA02_25080 [Salisediminibacterium halotolerans]